jgi:hypothetical protein
MKEPFQRGVAYMDRTVSEFDEKIELLMPICLGTFKVEANKYFIYHFKQSQNKQFTL